MHDELQMARAACESGQVDSAFDLTCRYLRCQRDDARGWELLGQIQFRRGRYRVAVSALERASLWVPLQPASRVCLARGYAQLGRTRLSRDLLGELIPDESLSASLLLQVAAGLDAIDHPHLAMRACRELARREPGHAQTYFDLGYYAARCGLPLGVTEALARRAISLEPGRVAFRLALASLLLKHQRASDALQLVRQFSVEQIDQIRCANCLRKLLPLYQTAGDDRRAVLCRRRIDTLDKADVHPDCS